LTAIALTIAGSDSSGGAGIQADLKTFAAHQVYGASVIVALTAQNTRGVSGIHAVPRDFVAQQIDAVFEDLDVAAVKIGMLGTAATIDTVASVLASSLPVPVVLDPVLASTSGRALLADSAVHTLKRKLLPLCRLVTPNLPELALLAGRPVAVSDRETVRQAEMLLATGVQAVLAKGGHAEGDRSTDLLVTADGTEHAFDAPRLAGTMRGTGCMLASAIAAHLALGETLEHSIARAKRHVFTAMAARLAD